MEVEKTAAAGGWEDKWQEEVLTEEMRVAVERLARRCEDPLSGRGARRRVQVSREDQGDQLLSRGQGQHGQPIHPLPKSSPSPVSWKAQWTSTSPWEWQLWSFCVTKPLEDKLNKGKEKSKLP